VLPPPVLTDGDYRDRPASRPDDWTGTVRGIDPRLGAPADDDNEDVGGGLEQAQQPGQEIDHPLTPDPITADPLGLGDDDGDVAADRRAMDQARALGTARSVYAIDAAGHRPDDLQVDF
jgi:type IV secretion system protein VirD4